MGFWSRVFSHDRHLVDTIKMNFAAKSSAQLQEILQSDDQERWSNFCSRVAGALGEPHSAEDAIIP